MLAVGRAPAEPLVPVLHKSELGADKGQLKPVVSPNTQRPSTQADVFTSKKVDPHQVAFHDLSSPIRWLFCPFMELLSPSPVNFRINPW